MEKEITFEQAMQRLQEITLKLEKGNVSLDDALKLFEEGTKLSSFCYKKLEEAKQQVELISAE